MDNRKILILILGTASSIAVLFLIIYGGIVNNPALYTAGIGVVTSVLGAFLGYYFQSERAEAFEREAKAWRERANSGK